MSYDLTKFGLIVWVLCMVCFVATGSVNPGVPKAPDMKESGTLPHPGAEYTMSRDTNRYVKGFDHFCEFVGNDIGRGNLGCFVTFLVLLSTLSVYVVVLSTWLVGANFLPPRPEWHVVPDLWRFALAAAIALLIGYGLYKWCNSEVGVCTDRLRALPGSTRRRIGRRIGRRCGRHRRCRRRLHG